MRRSAVSFGRLLPLTPTGEGRELFGGEPLHLRGSPHPPLRSPQTSKQPLERLEVRGLTCIYPNSKTGIKTVDLDISRGTFTVITGRIGSGKTTLLQALLGLVPIDGGEILWNSKVVEAPWEFLVPPRCAYTPQVPRLFSDTVRNNILLGLDQAETDVDRAIRLAVLEPDVATLEDGLGHYGRAKGSQAIGGQAQRTAASRMFVRKPDLLLFDDLSSALDVETEQLLWQRVFEMEDVTSLVVSIDAPRYAERTTSSFSGKAKLMPKASSTIFCDPPRRCSESGLVISIVLNQPPPSTPIKIGVRKE